VGAGRALYQLIEEELPRMSNRFDLRHFIPKDDKATRLMAETAAIEAGCVYLPESAEWLDAFKQEVLNFPNGVHDDQVDSLTLFLRWARFNYYRRPRSTAVFG
jgi:predicted phage terminase large subunit-like protein